MALLKTLLAIAILWDAAAFASELIVTVKGRGLGKVLRRAEVRLGDQIYYTDTKGRVTLPSTNPEALVLVDKSDYERAIVKMKDLIGDPVIYLDPGAPDDNEVIVMGSRDTAPSKKIISTRETARVAPGGDPVQVTKLLPGVVSSGFGNQIIVRGSAPEDTGYYLDDIKVPKMFHQIGNLSIVPDLVIEQLDFTTGGFSAEHGDATGGILVLQTTKEAVEESRSELRLNIPFYTTLYHEEPVGENASVAVSARHSLTEWIIPQVIDSMAEEGSDVTVVPTFADAMVTYTTKDEYTNNKATLLVSRDGVVAGIPSEVFADEEGRAEIEFEDGFSLLAWEHGRRLEDGWKLRTTPQVVYEKQQFTVGENKGDIRSTASRLPSVLSKRYGKGRYLKLGFTPSYTDASFDVESIQGDSDDPFFDPEEAPVYKVDRNLSVRRADSFVAVDHLWGSVTLSPGILVQYSDIVDDAAVDPRLSFKYSLTSDFSFKGAVGQYSKEPQTAEASREFGNPDLGFETAYHYILGLEGKIGDRWQYDFQGFQKRVIHLIRSHPTKRYEDEGTLKVWGLELFLRRFLTEKTFGWLAYTYSVTEERANDQSPFHRSPFDITHVVHFAWAYKVTANWDLGTRIDWRSGDPYTPVTGAVYNSDTDRYSPTYEENNPYSESYPSFDSIDLFAQYESFNDEWTFVHRFGIQYLSLSKEASGIEYNYDYTESEFTESGLTSIPYYEIRGRF